MGLINAISLTKALFTATATANQVALGGYYVSPGAKEVFATQSVIPYGAASDIGQIVGKIQASATTVSTDFADITNAVFTSAASSDAAVMEQISFLIPASAVNLRYVGTVAAGPTKLAVDCNVFLVKRVS